MSVPWVWDILSPAFVLRRNLTPFFYKLQFSVANRLRTWLYNCPILKQTIRSDMAQCYTFELSLLAACLRKDLMIVFDNKKTYNLEIMTLTPLNNTKHLQINYIL